MIQAENRTAKSLKNSIVAIWVYIINLILQFCSRKIFLEYLGAEVLGLNTTANNLLQFLNLAELGIGNAVAFTLYKPLHNKDYNSINEIVSLQGWLYRKIAWVVIFGAAILMLFFPLIFENAKIPLWYAYASFTALLISALLSYFVNYTQIVLSADQKEYKIQYSYRLMMLVKLLFQIVAVTYFANGYIWWIILEVLFAFIASIALKITVKKTFPFLKKNISIGIDLRKKYPEILTKIKQVFFHKIGGFALTQTSPLIVYAYTSLTQVTIYANYLLIIGGVTNMITAVFNGISASVGNLVAEGNKTKILTVFEELFSIRYLFACTICYAVYTLSPGFITLWIGAEYLLDNVILLLLTATLYIGITRSTVGAFIGAYGLYSDIWAPILEATLNIGLSILFGYYYELYGILLGVLISQFVVIFCWQPYFLFKKGLKVPLSIYIKIYAKNLTVFILSILVIQLSTNYICHVSSDSWISLIYTGSIHSITFAAFMFIGLYTTTNGMKAFVKRAYNGIYKQLIK